MLNSLCSPFLAIDLGSHNQSPLINDDVAVFYGPHLFPIYCRMLVL